MTDRHFTGIVDPDVHGVTLQKLSAATGNLGVEPIYPATHEWIFKIPGGDRYVETIRNAQTTAAADSTGGGAMSRILIRHFRRLALRTNCDCGGSLDAGAFCIRAALYRSDKINELVFGVVGLLGIVVANFWLHTKILRKQCVEPEWVYLASGADIAVISLMTWLQGGIWGRVFPYYYPAVLCYALVFQSGITMFFTGTVVAAYAVLAAMSSPPMQAGDDQVLMARLLAIAGVAFVAGRYRLLEEGRRARIRNAEHALHRAC